MFDDIIARWCFPGGILKFHHNAHRIFLSGNVEIGERRSSLFQIRRERRRSGLSGFEVNRIKGVAK